MKENKSLVRAVISTPLGEKNLPPDCYNVCHKVGRKGTVGVEGQMKTQTT